jgi:superfamily II DNA or RNA helicase/HKD family nuclease
VADDLAPGLYESILTQTLLNQLTSVDTRLVKREPLRKAEAADRIAQLLAKQIMKALESVSEDDRVSVGVEVAHLLLEALRAKLPRAENVIDPIVAPGEVLAAIGKLQLDDSVLIPRQPLIPLLDTTLLTNAPGEPRVGHQIHREIESADSIDVVMAFVRRSGLRPLMKTLRRHTESGKPLRVLTTTYTGSTEGEALDQLRDIGAEIRVSYNVSMSRLHAKAWLFHRHSTYTTAYVGSSNLTHSAQNDGMEWNVRLSGARNPDVIEKVSAVFDSYWESVDFLDYDPEMFRAALARSDKGIRTVISPLGIRLEPFQERLLELIEVARSKGHHRNLLVSATGTGKTVMAAMDYKRLQLPRKRLLFVAHRREILEQSLATFRQALRDQAFGELWVGDARPRVFDHVFASVQNLRADRLERLTPDHFDVVIIDEFHHAAASSYQALLDRLEPLELLGLTATPERADGLPILHWFGDRIAAELRLWDAIEQHQLAPFAYYGIHDGVDLRNVPWRRGQGYDLEALSQKYTGNDNWARLVFSQLVDHVDDVSSIRCLGFCITVAHAQYMAAQFRELGLNAIAISGKTPDQERSQALGDLAAGRLQVVFSVDLFNEGVDVPAVDTLLMLRPTESPTLFLQQLGRGLRRADDKAICTVLDFVGHHHREFRYDRRYRALLGGTRSELTKMITDEFPFLPAGCYMELDPVAQEIVLQSVRNALPSQWRGKVEELKALHRTREEVSLGQYLGETGLELSDVYAGNRGWSHLREDAGLPTKPAGEFEKELRAGVGRVLHLDDAQRLRTYESFVADANPPQAQSLHITERRLLRMLVGNLASQILAKNGAWKKAPLQRVVDMVWQHGQVIDELRDVVEVLRDAPDHLQSQPLPGIPLQVHSKYTRIEILAAVGDSDTAKTPEWREGVLDAKDAEADLLVFTLDKTGGGFSPTTRYRDYAISPDLIHWESQSTTTAGSDTGQRYQKHVEMRRSILLFARENQNDRAFWFLGPATYVSHEGEKPMAVTWKLDTPLSGDLFAAFAAAVS